MEDRRYLEKFEESRIVTENYFEFLLQRNDIQNEQSETMSRSLDSVIEEVRAAGVVSAMAAREALQSHNKTFVVLNVMSMAQDYLTQLVADIKQNGGSGGKGGIGGFISSVIEGANTGILVNAFAEGAITAVAGTAMAPWAAPAMIAAGAVVGGASFVVNSVANAEKKRMSNAITDNALNTSSLAREIAENIAVEQNNPRSIAEAGPTFVGAIAMEATTPRITVPPNAVTVVPNPSTGASESSQAHNLQVHVAAMSPQPAQVIVQAAPPAQPDQTVNVNMHNEFKMPFHDPQALSSISEYLAQEIREQFSSRSVRTSSIW